MKLPKAYSAKKYENAIYAAWEKAKAFTPKIIKGKKPFTIMMPPPNATGTLHLGHAVMLALEDTMVRYHRMKGDPSLWVPGTDHASIATQNKVEKVIATEGKTRHSMGRKAFLKRVEQFVKGSQSTIRKQVRKMGSSCDWTREKYTLDPKLSKAVREIFVRMYNDKLIYRGNRIVNWCPRCTSTLADDEVVYKEEKTKFYYLKYGPFTIGTARPETKFLDKIIVVHPDDKRYQQWIGKEVMVPWIDGQVKAKIIADKSADPEFGSGAMTITPAHDFIDFEIAQRNKIEIVQIIDEKGNLTEHAGQFKGRNAREARADLIKKMEEKGLVERIDENYQHNLSVCYRCSTPIEPLVSRQWFISVDTPFGKKKKTLKQLAVEVVRKKEIEILPERFEKTYFQWMDNLHDWCISRQIWFGHQIPVWYCRGEGKKGRGGEGDKKIGDRGEGIENTECKRPIVSTAEIEKCPHCKGPVEQDPDTLDTWFSSGLWTFSTLGWPEKTKDLEYFHPTTVLETGYDILFFWVARMILMTKYAIDEVPFKHVYLHGLVRTRDGAKMSKSHPETCIDPLDMIEKYGADALRLSMIIGGAAGNDVRLYEEKIAGFRNFVNKIWNASRFALMQAGGKKIPKKLLVKPKTAADKWITTRLQQLVKEVTADIETFQFSEAGTKIYDFTWNEYCAWYLEFSKGSQQNLSVLLYVLETLLKLLHPFVPYVTEVIWKELGKGGAKNFIMNAPWPKLDKKLVFEKDAKSMSAVVASITTLRTLRQENNIDVTKQIAATFVSKKWKKQLEDQRESIMRMARLNKLDIVSTKPTSTGPVLAQFNNDVEVILALSDLVDLNKERARIQAEHDQLSNYIAGLEAKLSNQNFVGRAPAHIVEAEKGRLAEAKEKLAKAAEQIKNLG